MYDIPELERKWKEYKRKKIKKPLILAGSVIGLTAALFLGISYYKKAIPLFSEKTVATKEENASQKQAKLKEEEKAIIITKTPITASVQNNTEKKDEGIDLSNATIIKPNVPDDEIRVIGFDKKEKKEILNKYEGLINRPKQIEQVDPIVQEYEERFKESQDPQDALYLAEYFYKKGNYHKAEIWAANANSIDGEIEESWLIFAKAKAKQGHRVEAIKILQEYYDNTNSLQAKELLDKLRRNKPF